MPQYSQFQPKPYRPRMSAYWYLDQWDYLQYAVREASSFFVAYFAIIILLQVAALSAGSAAYAKFEACMASPIVMIVNAVGRGFAEQLAHHHAGHDAVSAMPNFAAWFGATIIVGLFILRII